jgi:uncharacterized damage-inducible protein DinB
MDMPKRAKNTRVRSTTIRQGYWHWLEAASDLDLTEEILTILPDGEEFRVPRLQIILHVINHTSYHRGQIVTMLRAFGVQPPDTDLTGYCSTMSKVAQR